MVRTGFSAPWESRRCSEVQSHRQALTDTARGCSPQPRCGSTWRWISSMKFLRNLLEESACRRHSFKKWAATAFEVTVWNFQSRERKSISLSMLCDMECFLALCITLLQQTLFYSYSTWHGIILPKYSVIFCRLNDGVCEFMAPTLSTPVHALGRDSPWETHREALFPIPLSQRHWALQSRGYSETPLWFHVLVLAMWGVRHGSNIL